MIHKLCSQHTNLDYGDINTIVDIASSLQYFADIMAADIFIDCKTRDPNAAIVVAQAKPAGGESRYRESVIGQLALRKNEPAVLRTLESGLPSRDLIAVTQEHKTVKQVVVPITGENNRCIGVLISEVDVTENLAQDNNMKLLGETADQLTTALISFQNTGQDRYQELGSISTYLNDAIIIFNDQGYATYANPQAKKLYRKLGYHDGIVNMHFNNLLLGDSSTYMSADDKSFFETEITVGNMSLHIKYGISPGRKIMLIKDLTDVREKEKELILKSYAIKEIHHRVKNNLQTVASLLALQSRRIKDEKYKAMFRESIGRIMSIAITHEVLTQNYSDKVNIKGILGKLLGIQEYNGNIKLTLTGDNITMDSDKAVSVALVVNELLHNSVKHAFSPDGSGNIDIAIKRGNFFSEISVSDNGKGFDMEKESTDTLGFKIVENIVKEKLGGNVAIESTNIGTKVIFDFRND